ncbi:ATP-binding cassette domain-containing protein [Haloarchaeobius amylolyticus]|uniref:ATP-binding cassette domain-containing protein n=1 Tax=Haloarchaeobius amylolyticus TaxID=1198296 RepID=UPI00226EE45B|nr:ATP-binding cassette domain-containing protein [Haloarchaeobius amylolyticus]
MISVADVTVAYGDATVLDSVSLSVDAGTFVGLVGPNGAGKTTLLRTMSAALAPETGSITVCGEDVQALSAKAASRQVAVVPQDTTVSFSFPVRDLVAMGRTPHRSRFTTARPEDHRAIDDAIERVGIADLADRPVDELSGGERQKVAIARALAQETPVLLLDEPTASLDVNHQIETLELVRELVADGKTAVAAIHDLSLAARYCDELALLAGGDIVASGEPDSVLTRPRLRESFDAETVLTRNPVTESVTVTPLAQSVDALDRRVHVLGNGSVAARTLERLASADAAVTVGPAPPGDAVVETARLLGVDPLLSDPYTALDEASVDSLRAHVAESDVVVLAEPHLSAGNSAVLDVVAEADSLVVVEDGPWRASVAGDLHSRYAQVRERATVTDPETVARAVQAAGQTPERPPNSYQD